MLIDLCRNQPLVVSNHFVTAQGFVPLELSEPDYSELLELRQNDECL